MNSPPVPASFQRCARTRHSRFVFLAISGLNLGPPPLLEARRLGPCSQGSRRSAALSFRLPGQIHPPMAEGGFSPLLLRASWRTGACDFHRTPLKPPKRPFHRTRCTRPCALLQLHDSTLKTTPVPLFPAAHAGSRQQLLAAPYSTNSCFGVTINFLVTSDPVEVVGRHVRARFRVG